MQPTDILDYCTTNLTGTVLAKNWGEQGIFYNPGNVLKKGVYILTIKEKDGENDNASRVNREGVYRMNLGLRKETFRRLFHTVPPRPPAGGVVDLEYDFAKEKFRKRLNHER